MKVNGTSFLERTRRQLGRAVAFVLFAGIIYSASFGTIHSHGNAARTPDAGTFTRLAAAGMSFAVPVSSSTSDECLICVLHRQLSFSTVDLPHFVLPPEQQVRLLGSSPDFYHSTPLVSSPVARLSGRAPPPS